MKLGHKTCTAFNFPVTITKESFCHPSICFYFIYWLKVASFSSSTKLHQLQKKSHVFVTPEEMLPFVLSVVHLSSLLQSSCVDTVHDTNPERRVRERLSTCSLIIDKRKKYHINYQITFDRLPAHRLAMQPQLQKLSHVADMCHCIPLENRNLKQGPRREFQ